MNQALYAHINNKRKMKKKKKKKQTQKMNETFFFGVGLGFELRTKQVLYCLSHSSNPFCSGYFGEGVFGNYLTSLASNHVPSGLRLQSR
jgi:hypothetical protein